MTGSSTSVFHHRFVVYLLVATVVGLITVALREVLGYALGPDTPLRYSVSVLFAYCCGVVLNFVWQARFTFAHRRGSHAHGRFVLFAAFASASALLTALFSWLLRYAAGFDAVFGDFSAAIAFAVASLLVSVFSYSANSRYVFLAAHRRE